MFVVSSDDGYRTRLGSPIPLGCLPERVDLEQRLRLSKCLTSAQDRPEKSMKRSNPRSSGSNASATIPPPIAETKPEKNGASNNGHVSSPELAAILASLQTMRDGDLSVRLPGTWTGLAGKIADTFNDIVSTNQQISQELKRAGQVVGKEGKTRERIRFHQTKGAWGEMEVSVNTLIDDLLRPTTEVTRAIAGVAQGNLTQTVRLDVDGRPLEGEFLRSATIVNTMIQQLSIFTSEVTRVAREVGTDGKLGGQAQVPGVAGTWKDLTDSVNSMASNLTGQVRNIAEVATAVASGDLSRKITVDVRGEILQLKEAINTMVDQLRSFASEVTRVAREVGTDGKLGGQAVVPGVAGTWKDLTDSVNAMAGNLTAQVRNIAEVTTAVARGDLSRKITVDVKGEILALKDTINTMVDQLNAFAGEVTRVAREVGTEGKLGGQAEVPGVGGTWKDLTDNVNFMASNLTGQVRNIAEVATAIATGDLVSQNYGRRPRRNPPTQRNAQHHGGPAQQVRWRSHARGARSRFRRPPWRSGKRSWRCGHVERPHRQRQLHGQQPDWPGSKHRGSHDGRCARRLVAQDHRRREGRNSRAEKHHQYDGGPTQRVRRRSHPRGARSRHRRQTRRSGRSARRRRYVERSHRQRQLHGQQPDWSGSKHRRSRDGCRARRLVSQDHGRRQRRNSRTQRHAEHDGGSAAVVRVGSHACGARSWYRRKTRRSGAGARAWRELGRTSPTLSTRWPATSPARFATSRKFLRRLRAATFRRKLRSTSAAKFCCSKTPSTRWWTSSTRSPAKSPAWRAKSVPKVVSAVKPTCRASRERGKT